MNTIKFSTLVNQYHKAFDVYCTTRIGSDRYKKAEARMATIFALIEAHNLVDEFVTTVNAQRGNNR